MELVIDDILRVVFIFSLKGPLCVDRTNASVKVTQ